MEKELGNKMLDWVNRIATAILITLSLSLSYHHLLATTGLPFVATTVDPTLALLSTGLVVLAVLRLTAVWLAWPTFMLVCMDAGLVAIFLATAAFMGTWNVLMWVFFILWLAAGVMKILYWGLYGLIELAANSASTSR